MPSGWTVLFGGLVFAGFVGFLTGVFGVGGGFLLTPGLVILLRVPPSLAVGTSLAAILVTSTLAMVQRRGTGTLDFKLAGFVSCGSLAGVFLGQNLMVLLRDVPPLTVRGRSVGTLEYVLLWGFLVLFAGIAGLLYRDHRRTQGRDPVRRVGWFARLPVRPLMHFPSLEEPHVSAPLVFLLGAAIGVLTGLMGIGGGVLWLPGLVYLVGQRTARAVGTSLGVVWLSAFGATVLNLLTRNIHGGLWLTMAAGGLVGTVLGTRVGLGLGGARLRYYFVLVVLAAVALVAWRLVTLTCGGQPG